MPFAFSELLVIAVVVMALFGSRRIPRLLGDLGRSLGSARKKPDRKDASFLDETGGRGGRNRQDGGRRG